MRFTFLLSALLLCACASGVQKMRKIDPGMSFAQVDDAMGRRDSFKSAEEGGNTYTLYQYTNQFCNAHVDMREKCDFYVVFKNGEVIETGVKSIREKSINMQYIHLFQHQY